MLASAFSIKDKILGERQTSLGDFPLWFKASVFAPDLSNSLTICNKFQYFQLYFTIWEASQLPFKL